MSEGHSEQHPGEAGAIHAEPEPNPPPTQEPARSHGASRYAAGWLAAALTLIIAGVALSPFWAPAVAPLLPWGEGTSTLGDDYAALAERVAAVEKRSVSPGVEVEAIKSTASALGRRIEQLETALNARLAEIEKRPVLSSVDVDAIKSAESALTRRVDQLEAATGADRQRVISVVAAQPRLQEVEQRLGAIEARSSSREANETAEFQKMGQELSRLGSASAELAARLPALEQQLQSRSGTDRADAALALILLQMRSAVEQARPFPAEYSAFKALARDPDVAAADEPLAEAAQKGVASRVFLGKRLAELGGRVAAATELPGGSDWGAQALARLRGLVTIRRIDGGSQTEPEAAMSAAQAALARGDLPGAVAALDALTGASAAGVRSWLQMARERLAVETALDHLQQLLGARLVGTPAAPAAAPSSAPAEPSGRTRTPS